MSLESIYFISQISAVILLLVSVVFVGLQIRDNTRATRAASAYDVMKTWGLYNREFAFHPALASLAARSMSPTAHIGEFSDVEQAQLAFGTRALLQLWLSQFTLYKEGSLQKEYWELQGQFAANYLQLPIVKALREREEYVGYMTEDFAEELSRLGDLHRIDLSAFSINHKPE